MQAPEKKFYLFTLLFRGPRREDLASGAWQESQSPVATCMTKQTESPYLISGTPMPSMSLFGPESPFSCCVLTLKNKTKHTLICRFMQNKQKVLMHPEVWKWDKMKKHYDQTVIKEAGQRPCFHGPARRLVLASLALLRFRGTADMERSS